MQKLPAQKEWEDHVNSLKSIKISTNQEKLKQTLINSVKKRIPKKKFGILFSGGIDSTLIALICKQFTDNFICYSVGLKGSLDIESAKKVAKELKLKLKVIELDLNQAEEVIEDVVKIIKEPDVTKVGVGSVVYSALQEAKKDKIKNFFSGLGSEELFAGYQRHAESKDINEECWRGLKYMYDRDFTRDFKIAAHFKVRFLLPFLDDDVILYGINFDAKEKIDNENKKIIIRKIAIDLGLKKEFALRKKKAAQYGSKFTHALDRIARKSGFKLKKDYLATLLKPKLAALFSSGKDSTYAIYIMEQKGYRVSCLITLKSKNKSSYMFHTPNVDLVKLQAEAMNLPLIEQKTTGEKEKELKDLEKAIKKSKKLGAEGIITGAVFSNYQRERIEKICIKLGLKVYSPLWHIDQEMLIKSIVKDGFKVIISSIAADGLDESFLGAEFDENLIKKLKIINKKNKIHLAGEGGEFETFVLDCPLFNQRIKIENADKIMENERTGIYVIKEAKLAKKQ